MINIDIKTILLLFLKEKVVAASWGIYNVRIMPNRLLFSVEAMKYQGVVQITPINTTFCRVRLHGKKEFLCRTENLVLKLDNLIENHDNYYANLLDWFNQQKKLYVRKAIIYTTPQNEHSDEDL